MLSVSKALRRFPSTPGDVSASCVCTHGCHLRSFHRTPIRQLHHRNVYGRLHRRGFAQTAATTPGSSNPTSSASASFHSLKDGVFTVTGIITSAASPELVYAALAPEDSCKVFGNVEASKVTRGPGGMVQVEQTCRWRFFALSGTFEAVLDVNEQPQELAVTFALRQSSFMRQMDGHWRVLPTFGGGCTVQHILSVRPAIDMPDAVAQCAKSIFVDQERQILDDLLKEVERQVTALQPGVQLAGVVDRQAATAADLATRLSA